MRYFFDNCLSFRYAEMLRALNVDVVAMRDELPTNSKDTDIFKYLAGTDRIFVSLDRKQLTRICEAHELKIAGINAIYFGPFWGKKQFWDQAAWLVRRWEKIDLTQQGLAKGTVVELKENGNSMPIAL